MAKEKKPKKVDKEYQDELPAMKKAVERTVSGWKSNVDRFHKFQKFLFKTAITPTDESALNTAQKPVLEFNITNAPVSRQCGEFSKQEPSIEVMAEFGAPIDPKVIEVVDGHLRHIIFESKKHNTQYMAYRDSLSGGFFNFKVWTEYAHEMSFDQVIKFGRTFNPTFTFYDLMAREVDKSDAEFCFEIFPMDKEQFKRDYPWIPVESLSYLKLDTEFNWSYKNQEQYVIILVDYYKKKKTRKTIVKLADNQVMPEEHYEEFVAEWNRQQRTEQPPAIVDERESEFTTIMRYRFIEDNVIEVEEMESKHQPLIFGDGDSAILQEDSSSTLEQFTKPYIYHAEGLQRMTNFAGQMIANDFENMVMNKYMIPEEALPTQEDAVTAWSTPQKPDVLIYKALYDNNPDQTLPGPQVVQRVGLPQEVIMTFNNSMNMLQAILGSYDASLATGNNDVSGKAIVESATLSNSAAMPYVVNYMQALTRVAIVIVDWMPRYYKTPRTIPVINKEGKRDFVKINQEGGVDFNYDSNQLSVRVEAGVNFAIAKNQALEQITMLMKVSEEFAAFMTEVGLETILDNVEFRNSDILKAKVMEWQQKKAQEKKNQPDPEMIKAQMAQQQAQQQFQIAQAQLHNQEQLTQLKSEELASKSMLDTERVILEQKKVKNEELAILQKSGESQAKMEASIKKAEAEEYRAAADIEMKHAALHLEAHAKGHEHAMDIAGHHHEVNKHEAEIKQATEEPKGEAE